MTSESLSILVTGGSGFIGSALVRRLLADTPHRVVNLDKLTYAASPEALAVARGHPRYAFERVDVSDGPAVREVFARHRPDRVMHLAAESHVDRSIDEPSAFIRTNIVGTFTLLEVAAEYWRELPETKRASFRFHHVSTDEVFGSLGEEGRFHEDSPYRPNSPYAASKASADHLARAWAHTFGLPVVMSNCSNNFGPFQFPEKLIPLVTIRALEGQTLPVYGDGMQVRDWLHVDDHVDALLLVQGRGRLGESYAVGGYGERANLEIVRAICAALDEMVPDPAGPRERLIRFVADRPGHDRRYAIDPAKVTGELGWRPRRGLEEGLRETLVWYLDNRGWWEAILAQRYDCGRLGTERKAAAEAVA